MGIVQVFTEQYMVASHRALLHVMSGGTTHKTMAHAEEQIGVII
jgi:hypothetical protein